MICGFLIPDSGFQIPDSGFRIPDSGFRLLGLPLVRSYMNGLKPFERTTKQTTETMSPSPQTRTAAAMTTNRITILRELLQT